MITLIKVWASIRVTVTKQGKIMERWVAAVLLGLWISCGCTKAVCGEAQDITTEEARGTDICCSPIFDEEEAKGAIYDDPAYNAIHDKCLFIFDKDGKRIYAAYRTAGEKFLDVKYPNWNERYDVYAFANLGDLTGREEAQTSTGLDALCVGMEALSQFTVSGFPMARKYTDVSPENKRIFLTERLTCFFRFRCICADSRSKVKVTSMKLIGSAADIHPFSMQEASGFDTKGRQITGEDLATLNSGGELIIYFPENLQGNLLEGNTEISRKTAAKLTPAQLDKVSYISLDCTVTYPDGSTTDKHVELFPGRRENFAENFDLVRSSSMSLVYLADRAPEGEVEMQVDKTGIQLISGIVDVVTVRARRADGSQSKLTITTNDPDISVVQEVGQNATTLKISSSKQLEYLLGISFAPKVNNSVIRIEAEGSTNPEFLSVQTYVQPFPILFKIKEENGDNLLYAYSNNPMGLGLEFDFKCYNGTDRNTVIAGTDKVRFYNGVDSLGHQINGALSTQGGLLGSVGDLGKYPDGFRIEINAHCLGQDELAEDGITLSYPRFETSRDLYMGHCYRSIPLGSGDRYRQPPSDNFITYTSDTHLIMDLIEDGNTVDMYINYIDHSGCSCKDIPDYYERKKYAICLKKNSSGVYGAASVTSSYTLTPPDRSKSYILQAFPPAKPDQCFFSLGKKTDDTPGSNTQNDYDINSFSGCPFYCTNGGMVYYSYLADIPSYYNNPLAQNVCDKLRGYAYSPGRDLMEFDSGITEYGWNRWSRRQIVDNCHTWDGGYVFKYSVHMEFNGCSCWPGAYDTEAGCREIP